MTVLDGGQRYLRLDEVEGSPIVDVAEGVTFIATNIGNEYTSTRVMDRASLIDLLLSKWMFLMMLKNLDYLSLCFQK